MRGNWPQGSRPVSYTHLDVYKRQLVQDTCPLPLLDHWRDTVLELLQARAMLSRLPSAIGALEGHRLAIDVPALTTALGDLIRNGTLGASRYELASGAPLRRVA